MIFHFLTRECKKCNILVIFHLLVTNSKSFCSHTQKKNTFFLLLLEIVNMETFAERSVADSKVDLEHKFVCIRYCINCTVTICRSENSAVIDPLEIKDIFL
jgi:hypothetical protein